MNASAPKPQPPSTRNLPLWALGYNVWMQERLHRLNPRLRFPDALQELGLCKVQQNCWQLTGAGVAWHCFMSTAEDDLPKGNLRNFLLHLTLFVQTFPFEFLGRDGKVLVLNLPRKMVRRSWEDSRIAVHMAQLMGREVSAWDPLWKSVEARVRRDKKSHQLGSIEVRELPLPTQQGSP